MMSDQRKSALARMAGNVASGMVTVAAGGDTPADIATRSVQVAMEIMDRLDGEQILVGKGPDSPHASSGELRVALREACKIPRTYEWDHATAGRVAAWENM